MRITLKRRQKTSLLPSLLTPVVSIIISLLLGAIILSLTKANPWQTYRIMFAGAFGSWNNFTEVLVKSTPLILTGLAVSLAFRLKFWNVGAEGQLIWGGIGAAAVGLFIAPPEGGTLIYLFLALLGAMAGGALWASIPALLKTRLKVDETLTTLMLNYIAILIYQYLFNGPWAVSGFRGSRQISQVLWIPQFAGRAHIGIFIALALAILLWFIFNRTQRGFEWNMIGKNPRAAHVLGVDNKKNILTVLLISGALAGLAGGFEVLGISHRLQEGLNSGYGYTAIIIAWMALLNPLSVLWAAILMAALLVGGDQVQSVMGLPSSIALVLQGLILMPLLAGAVFREYKLKIRGGKS